MISVPLKVRQWFYGVSAAAMPLLISYGYVNEEAAPLWLAGVNAVLLPGLALANAKE